MISTVGLIIRSRLISYPAHVVSATSISHQAHGLCSIMEEEKRKMTMNRFVD